MIRMNVLLNTYQLIEVNDYNVNLTINNQNYDMLIKKSDSLQNLYDKIRDEYIKCKINTTEPDHIIQNTEYWFTDIIDKIYMYNKKMDNIIVIPENNKILVNEYINDIRTFEKVPIKNLEPNNLFINVFNYVEKLFNLL